MTKPRQYQRPLRRLAAIGGLCLALAACGGRVVSSGYELDPERLAEIIPGTHTKKDVELIMGSPSTISLFDGEIWYYISKQTETIAFFEPDVKDRRVIVINFTPGGYVQSIDAIDQSAGRTVELVDRETPTSGTELTILQQMFGNLGRFEKGANR